MEPSPSTRRFSVLIPVFNRRDLVSLTVDSVLAQTFADFEVIVVDDGSTDQSVERLLAYASRIRLLRQEHRGAEAARSAGAAVATGEYLVLLDSDDLLFPTALDTYDRIIRSLDAPPVILGAMRYFSHGPEPPAAPPGDRSIQVVRFPDFLAKDRGVGLSCSCIVIKRTVAGAKAALRPTATAFPFDGNDIMLRLGTCSPCIQVKRPFTVGYRSHDGNVSRQLAYLIESTAGLARLERRGDFPGGAARRTERRAYVGGVCWAYISRGLRQRLFRVSLRALIQVFPMVVTGATNAILRRYKARAPVVILDD